MRQIYIGDVHGCLEELEELLRLVEPGNRDRLLFVGDLVDRGPDSIGVLTLVQQLVETGRASVVVGNHEDKPIRLRDKAMKSGSWDGLVKSEPWHRAATDDHYAFLRSLPLLVRSGPDTLVVHGGLYPRFFEKHGAIGEIPTDWRRGGGKRIERMRRFIRVRHIDDAGNMVPLGTEGQDTRHWSNWYDGRAGWVFYGHDPALSPRRCAHCTGLDTGCVFGGQLTAAVVRDGTPPAEAEFISVRARQGYAPSKYPLA